VGRVWDLLWRAEVLTLALASGCAWLIGQRLSVGLGEGELGLARWAAATAIYTQLALFIGVFTQIIFANRSASAMLETSD
jgi:hypothetical protein